MTKIERQHLRLLEAILFAAAEPLSEKQLAARLPDDVDLKGMLDALRSYYESRGCEFTLPCKSFLFLTADDLVPFLETEIDCPLTLSRAAIAPLSLVAYHHALTLAAM